MASSCCVSHCGIIIPRISESARIVKFLVDEKSMNCNTDIPTAATMPKTTVKVPPIIGSGIRVNTAPNFPTIPPIKSMKPATWKTRLLAT